MPADKLDQFQQSRTWIGVAGLDNPSLLPDYAEVYYASRAVGRSIADNGFGLLVGGWSGVDDELMALIRLRLGS